MSEISKALAGLEDICEPFVDDIVVWADTPVDEFFTNLQLVFERLRVAKLRLKKSKCVFGLGEVEHLGHVVNGQGIKLSPLRQQAIQEMAVPKNATSARSFYGMANYVRNHIRNFSMIAKPLSQLGSSKKPFRWTDEEQTAFEQIKNAIANAPMLHHLDYESPIVVRTDASNVGVGGVLLNLVDGVERIVAYVSKAFDGPARNWATIEQEAYGIYFAITSWEHLLLGHRFTVESGRSGKNRRKKRRFFHFRKN